MIQRIKEDLVQLGDFGREESVRVTRREHLDPEHGFTRPLGSEANKKARDFIVKRMKAAGIEVKIDTVGNIFGRMEGVNPHQKAVLSGSHLDTVPNGGMFDGALGVVTALEAVRRLKERGFENKRPIEVVVFTGEEGSSFRVGLLGSSVLAGKLSVDEALHLQNKQGITLEEVLERIGYKGSYERKLDDVEFFIEMHIEQGPILHSEHIPVGIVERIAGITWLFATIQGSANHAGTTPMKMRQDTLVAASKIVRLVNKRAKEMVTTLDSSTVGTVGELEVYPNTPNIIPGKVNLGIDIRDVKKKNIDILVGEVIEALRTLGKKQDVQVKIDTPIRHLPTSLSREVITTIERVADQLEISNKRMNSGAGHDAQNMAAKTKAGMIFLPSVNGISHAPMEWTDWKDIERGTRVLTETLKHLSQKIKSDKG